MCRIHARRVCVLVWAVAFSPLTAADEALEPARVPGLVAWYDLHTVHGRSLDGDTVDRWVDSSGRGHDLKAHWETAPPRFHTKRLNDRPIVVLHRANRFDLSEPFELRDHTIFLVYATDLTKRAFFSSDTDPRLGVVLRDDGRFHYLQNSKNGIFRYNRATPPAGTFSITVLGRESGVLHAFVNGSDKSSGISIGTPLRVGRLFEIQHTTFVGSDGEGLRIAEMIFYDRHLTRAEREGVTRHLADKFGIEVTFTSVTRAAAEERAKKEIEVDEAAVQVRASTRTDVNVNEEIVGIEWDFPGRIDGPFHFDVDSGYTRLVCTRDATRVRLTVKLPLRTRVADASIRVLFLVNREIYLPEDAVSDPFAGQGPDKASAVALQAELTMNDGDYVEVITSRNGAPGIVRMPTAQALFFVERIE